MQRKRIEERRNEFCKAGGLDCEAVALVLSVVRWRHRALAAKVARVELGLSLRVHADNDRPNP
jgi:hypothetical protein